ncbi:MAG: head-tail connector protein [Novosphingobium sp.]|uniref:head-tail connector protein n=1 Tax=Novosphingobium sp. TaxID=1874826 RepID=UPI002734295E|nr:head-tail connector protein [Novosphingobium sp.]MDP3550614.1 head-tail connector protein [Novosphingobium sp.]
MGLTLTQSAAGGPVTVAQVKAYIGIESSEWDAMLAGFIAAATAHAQNYLGKAIGSQEWALSLDGFADEIALPLGPVTDVGAVTYLDADRAEQTLDDGVYILDLVSTPQRIVRDPEESWPATANVPNAVTVAFTTGFATAPAEVVQAIQMLVAFWWENRSAVNVGNITSVLPFGVEALLQPLRRIVI